MKSYFEENIEDTVHNFLKKTKINQQNQNNIKHSFDNTISNINFVIFQQLVPSIINKYPNSSQKDIFKNNLTDYLQRRKRNKQNWDQSDKLKKLFNGLMKSNQIIQKIKQKKYYFKLWLNHSYNIKIHQTSQITYLQQSYNNSFMSITKEQLINKQILQLVNQIQNQKQIKLEVLNQWRNRTFLLKLFQINRMISNLNGLKSTVSHNLLKFGFQQLFYYPKFDKIFFTLKSIKDKLQNGFSIQHKTILNQLINLNKIQSKYKILNQFRAFSIIKYRQKQNGNQTESKIKLLKINSFEKIKNRLYLEFFHNIHAKIASDETNKKLRTLMWIKKKEQFLKYKRMKSFYLWKSYIIPIDKNKQIYQFMDSINYIFFNRKKEIFDNIFSKQKKIQKISLCNKFKGIILRGCYKINSNLGNGVKLPFYRWLIKSNMFYVHKGLQHFALYSKMNNYTCLWRLKKFLKKQKILNMKYKKSFCLINLLIMTQKKKQEHLSYFYLVTKELQKKLKLISNRFERFLEFLKMKSFYKWKIKVFDKKKRQIIYLKIQQKLLKKRYQLMHHFIEFWKNICKKNRYKLQAINLYKKLSIFNKIQKRIKHQFYNYIVKQKEIKKKKLSSVINQKIRKQIKVSLKKWKEIVQKHKINKNNLFQHTKNVNNCIQKIILTKIKNMFYISFQSIKNHNFHQKLIMNYRQEYNQKRDALLILQNTIDDYKRLKAKTLFHKMYLQNIYKGFNKWKKINYLSIAQQINKASQLIQIKNSKEKQKYMALFYICKFFRDKVKDIKIMKLQNWKQKSLQKYRTINFLKNIFQMYLFKKKIQLVYMAKEISKIKKNDAAKNLQFQIYNQKVNLIKGFALSSNIFNKKIKKNTNKLYKSLLIWKIKINSIKAKKEQMINSVQIKINSKKECLLSTAFNKLMQKMIMSKVKLEKLLNLYEKKILKMKSKLFQNWKTKINLINMRKKQLKNFFATSISNHYNWILKFSMHYYFKMIYQFGNKRCLIESRLYNINYILICNMKYLKLLVIKNLLKRSGVKLQKFFNQQTINLESTFIEKQTEIKNHQIQINCLKKNLVYKLILFFVKIFDFYHKLYLQKYFCQILLFGLKKCTLKQSFYLRSNTYIQLKRERAIKELKGFNQQFKLLTYLKGVEKEKNELLIKYNKHESAILVLEQRQLCLNSDLNYKKLQLQYMKKKQKAQGFFILVHLFIQKNNQYKQYFMICLIHQKQINFITTQLYQLKVANDNLKDNINQLNSQKQKQLNNCVIFNKHQYFISKINQIIYNSQHFHKIKSLFKIKKQVQKQQYKKDKVKNILNILNKNNSVIQSQVLGYMKQMSKIVTQKKLNILNKLINLKRLKNNFGFDKIRNYSYMNELILRMKRNQKIQSTINNLTKNHQFSFKLQFITRLKVIKTLLQQEWLKKIPQIFNLRKKWVIRMLLNNKFYKDTQAQFNSKLSEEKSNMRQKILQIKKYNHGFLLIENVLQNYFNDFNKFAFKKIKDFAFNYQKQKFILKKNIKNKYLNILKKSLNKWKIEILNDRIYQWKYNYIIAIMGNHISSIIGKKQLRTKEITFKKWNNLSFLSNKQKHKAIKIIKRMINSKLETFLEKIKRNVIIQKLSKYIVMIKGFEAKRKNQLLYSLKNIEKHQKKKKIVFQGINKLKHIITRHLKNYFLNINKSLLKFQHFFSLISIFYKAKVQQNLGFVFQNWGQKQKKKKIKKSIKIIIGLFKERLKLGFLSLHTNKIKKIAYFLAIGTLKIRQLFFKYSLIKLRDGFDYWHDQLIYVNPWKKKCIHMIAKNGFLNMQIVVYRFMDLIENRLEELKLPKNIKIFNKFIQNFNKYLNLFVAKAFWNLEKHAKRFDQSKRWSAIQPSYQLFTPLRQVQFRKQFHVKDITRNIRQLYV